MWTDELTLFDRSQQPGGMGTFSVLPGTGLGPETPPQPPWREPLALGRTDYYQPAGFDPRRPNAPPVPRGEPKPGERPEAATESEGSGLNALDYMTALVALGSAVAQAIAASKARKRRRGAPIVVGDSGGTPIRLDIPQGDSMVRDMLGASREG